MIRLKLSAIKISLLLITFSSFSHAQEVRVYNWSDYIDDSIIEDFEKETGIDVIYDVFDSNEVLEGKLLAGNTGYDIVAPSIEYLGRQIVAGIFLKLDRDQLPNYQNLDTEMLALLSNMDPGNKYGIPYMWAPQALVTTNKKR